MYFAERQSKNRAKLQRMTEEFLKKGGTIQQCDDLNSVCYDRFLTNFAGKPLDTATKRLIKMYYKKGISVKSIADKLCLSSKVVEEEVKRIK